MAQVTVDRYALDKIFGLNSPDYDSLGIRMAKGLADSSLGIVQNLVEVGADIHDTMMPRGYESLLNPAGRLLGEVKEGINYHSGIDYQGMMQGLQNKGLSGFWDKFNVEDIPELLATSAPYMLAGANPYAFGAISASMAKEMAKNTATNEGRDPNQTTLTDTITALPAGVAITALDSLVPRGIVSNIAKTIAKRTATTAAARVTQNGIANMVGNVAKSIAVEGATEATQELIQFAQEHQGNGVFEPEALSHYGVAGLLGGMSGGSMHMALSPVNAVKSFFTGTEQSNVPPAQPSLNPDSISTITASEGFQGKPEVEKQEWIDTHFGRLDLADGIGKLNLTNNDGSNTTINFNLNPTPDENGNIVYASITDPAGTTVDINKQGKLVNDIYGILQAKIDSFDSVEQLTSYVNSIGISNSPLLQSKLLEEVANINRVRLEAIQAQETLGSVQDTMSNSKTSEHIKSIYAKAMKESDTYSENELWASIGRMVFNTDTMEYIDLPSKKKAPQLAEVTGYEQKVRLYKYLKRFLNTNEERTGKVLNFIQKQYGMEGSINNGILSFKSTNDNISKPVVEQSSFSPSQTSQSTPPSTAGGNTNKKLTADTYKEDEYYNSYRQAEEGDWEIASTKQYEQDFEASKYEEPKPKKVGFKISSNKLVGFESKDQKKADIANAYIGYPHKKYRGATGKYLDKATEQGIEVNDEIEVNENTVAFVSINGNGAAHLGTEEGSEYSNNLKATIAKVQKILEAGGKIVTDNEYHSSKREYNIDGEGQLRKWLLKEGYKPKEDGDIAIWEKDSTVNNANNNEFIVTHKGKDIKVTMVSGKNNSLIAFTSEGLEILEGATKEMLLGVTSLVSANVPQWVKTAVRRINEEKLTTLREILGTKKKVVLATVIKSLTDKQVSDFILNFGLEGKTTPFDSSFSSPLFTRLEYALDNINTPIIRKPISTTQTQGVETLQQEEVVLPQETTTPKTNNPSVDSNKEVPNGTSESKNNTNTVNTFIVDLDGEKITIRSMPKDKTKPLARLKEDRSIEMQENITKEDVVDFLTQETNDIMSKELKENIYIKTLIESANKNFNIDLIAILQNGTDKQAKAFILNYYLGKIKKWKKKDTYNNFRMENELTNWNYLVYDAFSYAVGNLLDKYKIEINIPEVINTTNTVNDSFTIKGNEEIHNRQVTRLERAKAIAKRIGVDIDEQTQNLVSSIKSLKETLGGMLLTKENIAHIKEKFKIFVPNFADQSFIETFKLNENSLFYTTGYLGAINAINNNSPAYLAKWDDDTRVYFDILKQEDILKINEFKGIYLDDFISSLAQTLTMEFGLKPTDKLDDNAISMINNQAMQASQLILQSLISQGKIEMLEIDDKDNYKHRFCKLTNEDIVTNVSSYAKELGSRDIRTPYNSNDTFDNERDKVDGTQLRSNGVKVSSIIKKALGLLQKQSYKFNKEMMDVILDEELMKDEEFIKNITHYENPNKVHPNFREDITSANDSYKRTLDRLIDYAKETLTDTFWYKYQVNSNARFQPYATVANPVSDKLFARWIIDNSNENSLYSVWKNSNKKTTYNWKHAIVLAMSEAGVLKTKADKIDGKETLELFDTLTDNSTIKEAITLMSQGKKNDAIKLFSKGGLHSIRAFLDYYKYSQLKDGGVMKTSMPTEVDGLTNGFIFALLQIGNGTLSSTLNFLQMVGMFSKKGETKSIYEYRKKGLDDLYTTVSNSVSETLEKTKAVDFFTGIEAMGRSVAKSPVIVWLYNAGDYGIQMKVGSTILENFMNKAVSNPEILTQKVIKDLKIYYKEAYSKLESKVKATTPDADKFSKIIDTIIEAKDMLTYKEMNDMTSAFGNTVGALIIDSLETQLGAMSDTKILFSDVSQYINEVFRKTFDAKGKLAFSEQILIKDADDSGVATYSMDKEKNLDKKIGIYYIDNGKVKSMSNSPVEKVVQNPFNNKGKPKGQKRGYVVNVHNNDSIAIARAIIATINKLGYFGMPMFDATVGPAGTIDVFMREYNDNLYEQNKGYQNLSKLKDALIQAGTALSPARFKQLMIRLDTAIQTNDKLRAELYSEENGIDKALTQQMTGIQPYEQYLESTKSTAETQESNIPPVIEEFLFSSKDKDMGEFVETKTLDKDTSDFANLYTEIENNDIVQISDEHNNYLKEVINQLTKFLGDYQKSTNVHLYKGNKNKGKYYKEELSISMSNVATTGMSAREVYAHELVHKLTRDAYENDVKARNEMDEEFRLFKEYVAKNPVNIGADTLSYILSRPDAHEFMAFVSTNEEVMNATKTIKNKIDKDMTTFDRIQLFVKNLINTFVRLVRAGSHKELAFNDNMYDRTTSIVHELLTVNKKIKSMQKETAFGTLFRLTQKVNTPVSRSINTAINTIKSSSLGNALSQSYDKYGKAYRIANNKYVRMLSNEILERPEAEENQLNLVGYANMIQSNYMQISNAIVSKVNKLLPNASTELRADLKETILDLDLASTMVDSKEASLYLSDSIVRYKEISRIEDALMLLARSDKQKNTVRYMINQARGLGFYLARYDTFLNNAQLLNADNITNFKLIEHSDNVERLDTDIRFVTTLIDRLASLWGMNFLPAGIAERAGEYIAENSSSINSIMEYALAEVNISKKQLFELKGEEHLFIKGYSRTMTDPNYTYTVVPSSQVDMYKRNHWKIVSDITPSDRAFEHQQEGMFFMKRIDVDAGYESGIFSVQSPSSKGTVLDSIGISSANGDFKVNVDEYIHKLYDEEIGTGQMIPLLSPNTSDGIKIVNYRYTMTKGNKIRYLNMKSDIGTVLAETKAMTDRKIAENELNEKIVKTILDDFVNHKDSTKFVDVGQDTEYENQWNMLPRHTRKYIYFHTGANSIPVRASMLNEYFGYKNLDLKTIFKLKKDYYPLQFLEKIWRDSVSIVRTSIVIKTLSTIFSNEVSNIRTLATEMPLDKALKYVAEGWQATDAYRANNKRLLEIEQMIASKKPYDKNEYKRLQTSLAKNPVKDLFDAGKFEIIIDDMNLEKHEVNNIVGRYADRAMNKLPPRLRSLLNTIYIGEDTAIFRTLSKFVMYSDFTARYALYKYAIENNKSKEEALRDGDKYFIRYSVLQDSRLKYLNDSGFFMFSKYLLRVQKGIARILKKNPTAVLQQGLVEHMIGKSSDMVDSGLWNINISRFGGFTRSVTELGDPHLLTELGIF